MNSPRNRASGGLARLARFDRFAEAEELHGNEQGLHRWLLTYSDMITLMTAFFLMLYAMSVMNQGKFSALATSVRSGFGGEQTGAGSLLPGGGAHTRRPGHASATAQSAASSRRREEAMRNLRGFVEQQNLKGGVSVREDERGVIISLITDNMLFTRGTATLRPESRPALDQVARVLGTVPNTIHIEGHTCNLPVRTAQFPSNWELSTARAGSVLRYFTERGGLPGRRFAASGYAETRPLVPNTSEANRARNRRVDIVIEKTRGERDADVRLRSEIRRIQANPPPAETGDGHPETNAAEGPILEPPATPGTPGATP